MASAQAGTGTNAVHNNAQIYIRMAKLLETTDQYTTNIDKLATFFNDARAYYTSGRGQITNLLEIAHDRLKSVLGLEKSTPFNANQYLSHPWVPSYINLMQVVAKFAHRFEETHLRDKVNRLASTVKRPEPSSEVIDVDAEEAQNNDAFTTTQPQQMEALKPSSSHGTPVINTPSTVSSAPAIQSTGSAKPASAMVSETSREVKAKKKKPKAKINYSVLLELEKKAQSRASMNEQQQQAGQSPSAPPEAAVVSQPPPSDVLPAFVAEAENSLPSTSVQTSSSVLEPVTVSTPVQSRAHSNVPISVEQMPVPESRPPLPSTEDVIHKTAIEMEVDINESKRNDEDITMKDDEVRTRTTPHADDADVNMDDCIQTGRHDISATDDHEIQPDLPATEVSDELCSLTEDNELLVWKPAMEDQTVDHKSRVSSNPEDGELSSARAADLPEKGVSTPEEGELPHGATVGEPMGLVPQVAKGESTGTKSASPSTQIGSGSTEPPSHHHPEILAESRPGEGDMEIREEQVEKLVASDVPMNGSKTDPWREVSAPAPGTRQSPVTIDAKDNVKNTIPFAPTIISSSEDAEQQSKQSPSMNPPAVEPPRQTPSNGSARPTPSLPGSVRSTVTPKPTSTKSGKSTTPMGETMPKVPKLFIPAIDGFNNSMKVLAFHPVPPRGSVDFTLEIKDQQMRSFMSWYQRRDPESPKNNVHKSRCLSLACYTAKDIQRIKNEASVAAVNGVGYQYFNKIRSTFPTNDKLQLHIVTQNGKKHIIPLSLSVFPFLTRDGFIDLGNYIKEGSNVIKLYRPQRGFSEEIVFVLHVHSPTRAQLLELEKVLESDISWNNWLTDLTRPFDISSSPFAGPP
ncbi:hypothetical protein PQX77_007893 [Marasmius sp. AFHP31]|nr:hypothetical protein PQX77_007893 [Marasmius sp. AFHP31]